MASLLDPHWDAEQDQPPFRWRRSRLGLQAGSRQLGASLYELPPGAASFPLHIHHANEELLVVLDGRPTLRTLEGERLLETGEVVALLAGPRGAHRLDNRGEQPARVLIVSTMHAPEVNEYPDSHKIWVRDTPPGGVPSEQSSLDRLVFDDHPAADYFEGETG